MTFLFLSQPVPEEQQSGEDFGYVVAFRPLGSSTWIQTVLATPDASRYVYRNDSVAPLSEFEVKVGVYNSLGEGPFSQAVKVLSAEEGECIRVDRVKSRKHMLQILPDLSDAEPSEAPTRVGARAVSASEIDVYWEPVPPGSSTDQIIAYEV